MKTNLTPKQITFIQFMLKGYGLDSSTKALSKKERVELDDLVNRNIAWYQKRPIACYHIPKEERQVIGKILEQQTTAK